MMLADRVLSLAGLVHNQSPLPTCLNSSRPLNAGWSDTTPGPLSYVNARLRSNCGFLSYLALAQCGSGLCDSPKLCCEAACAWNYAGCGCLGGMDSLQEAITNIQVYQGVLNPPALVTSTCGFDAVYNTPNGNCDALPEKGSRQCPRAKPAMESETCTQRHKTVRMANLRTLLQLTTVPDAFGFNAGNAKRRLSEITAHSAAIAIGNGLIYAGQDEIYTYMVRPRVGYSGNTTATIQFSTADYKFHGRQLRFAYNVSAVDIKGNPFTFGPYFAVATFLSCSPRVESVYSSSQLSVYTMQAMSHTWPVPQKTKPVVGLRRLHQDTNSTEIVFGEQAPAPTSSPTDSSPTPSPPQASPPIPAPAPAPVPSPPGSISPPPPTPATTPSPPPSPPLPPVVFPPPPPSYSTDAMSTQDWGDGDYITLEDLADYFIAAANAVLQSPAMQSYQFTFAKGCVPSVIDNLQFCDVASGQGLFNIDSVGILGDTCTALCADGAWDAAGQWTCDVGCKAATDAACSSCKSGCSAACNTCKGSCNAACDACKGSVKTACESCKVACCYGCVWGKTCNCDSVCDPNKVCGKDCGCGGCDATCNCDQ